jgi:GT2 family glycosyltransferase
MSKKKSKTKRQPRRSAPKRPVSIVVPVMDKLEFTRLCLGALFVNTSAFELIVVDNASAQPTRDYLADVAARRENVTIIRNETNAGFAGSCNAGVRVSKHSLICLLNNDTVVQPGWLDRMREALAPGVGIVGAKLLFPDDTIQHCGIVFRDDMAPYHRYHGEPSDSPACNRRERVPGTTAACLLTWRRVWDEVDGMDEGYVRGNYEDVDFNLKVRDRGYSAVYQPEAVVYHFTNMTNSEQALSAGQAHHRNRRLFMARWGGRTDLAAV